MRLSAPRRLDIRGESLCRLSQVTLTDDVVAIEDAARLVTAELHGNPLRDASADHVADRSTAQIVEQPSGDACRLARPSPRRLEVVFQGVAVPMKHEKTADCPTMPATLDEIT